MSTASWAFRCRPSPFGWFKGEVNTAADIEGFKYRTVGLAADLLQAMGIERGPAAPGGEIVAGDGARRSSTPSSSTTRRPICALARPDVANELLFLSSYHQASEKLSNSPG